MKCYPVTVLGLTPTLLTALTNRTRHPSPFSLFPIISLATAELPMPFFHREYPAEQGSYVIYRTVVLVFVPDLSYERASVARPVVE